MLNLLFVSPWRTAFGSIFAEQLEANSPPAGFIQNAESTDNSCRPHHRCGAILTLNSRLNFREIQSAALFHGERTMKCARVAHSFPLRRFIHLDRRSFQCGVQDGLKEQEHRFGRVRDDRAIVPFPWLTILADGRRTDGLQLLPLFPDPDLQPGQLRKLEDALPVGFKPGVVPKDVVRTAAG